jgi:hypothetical protein
MPRLSRRRAFAATEDRPDTDQLWRWHSAPRHGWHVIRLPTLLRAAYARLRPAAPPPSRRRCCRPSCRLTPGRCASRAFLRCRRASCQDQGPDKWRRSQGHGRRPGWTTSPSNDQDRPAGGTERAPDHACSPGQPRGPARTADLAQVRLDDIGDRHLLLVDVTPGPPLAWLVGGDQGVLRLVEMPRRVSARRTVAATHVAARKAEPQMNPAHVGSQALFAAGRPGANGLYGEQVFTGLPGGIHGISSAQVKVGWVGRPRPGARNGR